MRLNEVARMRMREDQDKFLMRKSEYAEVTGVETNNEAALEDVGQRAELYIANQEDNV